VWKFLLFFLERSQKNFLHLGSKWTLYFWWIETEWGQRSILQYVFFMPEWLIVSCSDVNLGTLTIGPDTLLRIESKKKAVNNADSSDEDSDEGPQTVVISNISDLQRQMEIQKLAAHGVSQNTGATMRAPGASTGAVKQAAAAPVSGKGTVAAAPVKGSPAAVAAAEVVAAAGKQPPPLPKTPPPANPPPGPMKPKITVKQAAPRRGGVGRTLAMTKTNSSASLKKSTLRWAFHSLPVHLLIYYL
jgi:predicted DNA binding CopG/RHH family protein